MLLWVTSTHGLARRLSVTQAAHTSGSAHPAALASEQRICRHGCYRLAIPANLLKASQEGWSKCLTPQRRSCVAIDGFLTRAGHRYKH